MRYAIEGFVEINMCSKTIFAIFKTFHLLEDIYSRYFICRYNSRLSKDTNSSQVATVSRMERNHIRAGPINKSMAWSSKNSVGKFRDKHSSCSIQYADTLSESFSPENFTFHFDTGTGFMSKPEDLLPREKLANTFARC